MFRVLYGALGIYIALMGVVVHFWYKFFWVLRGLFFKPFLGGFGLPSYMGAPLFLLNAKNIYIGRRVRIFPGLRAECHGSGRLFVHDNVSIGQGFHVVASSDLHIGSGCLISANVFITDTDHTFDSVGLPVFNQPESVRSTQVGENCFLGIGARIQAGTTLGKGCVVGANAVVRGDFPDYCMVVGVPARIIKRFNHVEGRWKSV